MASTDGNNVVIVTGATGGVGTATAHAFAHSGVPLILCGRESAPLSSLKSTIQTEKTRIDLVCCDISDVDFPRQIINILDGRQIGVLAHVAGISPTMGSGKKIWNVNFVATKRLVEGLMPYMAQGSATILVSSIAGEFGSKFVGIDRMLKRSLKTGRLRTGRFLLRSPGIAYTMSKRAVQKYAQFMAPTFGKTGSRIVSISPGVIDTPMAKREKEIGAGSGFGKEAIIYDMASLGRMGRVDEIASVIKFLASPAASYITGIDLLVDGGTTAGVEAYGGVLKTFS